MLEAIDPGGSVSRGLTETLDEKHQRLLEAFVLRARRVEEHSLAADWDALVELTRISINVRVDRGEVGHVRWSGVSTATR
ncbi:hypothetical protein [Streptomyces sp. NPDC019208]|uniref:hypothetical protein n=1 Tax=Streptomyces sp. NPDC019208 TaxID=3154683 RepID=UPI003410EC39